MPGEVNSENYVVIQGWMLNDLDIKGNELIVYAIIYGFSQVEGQVFNGSLQYLANWTKSTKQGVMKNLKSLVDKGYIVKIDKYVNGVKFCEYHATKFNRVLNKVEEGMQQSLTPPIKQSLPNNLSSNKIVNIKEEKKERKKENNKSNYDLIIDELVNDADIKDAILEFIKMRKLIKAPLTDRALKQLITKLYSLSTNKEEQLEILNNAILNNWKSIYPLKKEATNNYNASNRNTRVEIVPDWLNKQPKREEATAEEVEELKKGFEEIDFEQRRKKLQEKLKRKYAK